MVQVTDLKNSPPMLSKHRAVTRQAVELLQDNYPEFIAKKIGVSAPQGSGKTTLVFALNYLFRVAGRNSATLSIDDFYLTAEEQAKLREQNPGNALLEFHENARSHDLQFSVATLESLIKLTKEGMKMKLPRYEKSTFGGRGDRADPSVWPEVEGPIEVFSSAASKHWVEKYVVNLLYVCSFKALG